MQLLWVPSLVGATDNEQTYVFAKLGAKGQYQGPEPAIGTSKSHVGVLLNEWAQAVLGSYHRRSVMTACRLRKR